LDVAPENHGSIFMVVRNFVGVAATGALYRSQPDDHAAIAYYWSGRVEELNSLIARYNAGERWFKHNAA
jgi:hypothetical protein